MGAVRNPDDHALTEAGLAAAQSWIDERGGAGTKREFEQSLRRLWLQAFVERDGSARIQPCTARPDAERVLPDGPAPGPDGEPGIGLRLWRPLEFSSLPCGVRVAVFVEKPVADGEGGDRRLWMPE